MTRLALVILLLLAATAPAWAERLPIAHYSAANGLPHDRVKCIVRDSHGFLWFCTAGGLSRFDGEQFVNYGTVHGLSHVSINDVAEGPGSTYWVATNGGGVCRFTPGVRRSTAWTRAPAPTTALFSCFRVGDGLANRVNTVAVDVRGRVWAGTDAGLFTLDPAGEAAGFVADQSASPRGNVWTIAQDAEGDVWVGSTRGLARYHSDGSSRTYTVDALQRSTVWALMFDREQRLWIAHDRGLLVVRPLPFPAEADPLPWRSMMDSPAAAGQPGTILLPSAPGEARAIGASDGFTLERPGFLLEAADGHVWIGSELWAPGAAPGVAEFDGRRVRMYMPDQGLSDDPVIAVAEDRQRNVWLATMSGGAMRIRRGGFVSYGEREGLAPGRVHGIFPGPGDEFYTVTEGLRVHRFDGTRFVGIRPNIGAAEADAFFQVPMIDRAGEWWIPTHSGLFRFARPRRFEDLARAAPMGMFGERDGLPGNAILSPFEDAQSDVWFGISGHDVVVRWERRTGIFHVYDERHGVWRNGPPIAFRHDGAGNLWMGFQRGGVGRFRHGRFEMFGSDAGAPTGHVGTLHLDARGRMWIGSRDAALTYLPPGGHGAPVLQRDQELARIDDPDAPQPALFLYPQELLSGHGVRSLVEDGSGTLYIGGDQGVQRFTPDVPSIRRYTVADGLPSGDIECAFIDAGGRIWFGTWRGVARLAIPDDAAPPPPAARITQLLIRGVPYPVGELGESTIEGLQLGADQNLVEIGFSALAFSAGRPPRYQYRLEGADLDWGLPTEERRVTYVSLSPGAYRFVVRAITADEVVTEPATIAFVVLRPVWQRPWFIAAALATALLVAAAVHRARVARLLGVERMRTRIATDLHDDIGASLSQIAVLAEVVRQRRSDDPAVGEPLDRIATTSRELIDSMSELVWAINPRRDSLSDLSQRMRRFASDVLTARGIEFTFRAPAHVDQVRLDVNVRRQVFLVFKEAINNLVRHAGATGAAIDLALDGAGLTLEIADNGRGFDRDAAAAGHGLASLQARAHAIGATLTLETAPGHGVRVRLHIPRRRRLWPIRLFRTRR